MDSWEKEHKELEHEYHKKLKNMISVRVKFEAEENQREKEMEAAQAIIMLQHREEKKVKRIAKKEKVASTPIVPRRSSRISLRC